MAERERAQERAERRGSRQPAAQQPSRAPRAQQLAVIDAVGAERHRIDKCDHFASRVAGAGPITAHTPEALDESLDAEPFGERRDQRDPRVADDAFVVEIDPHAVQSDRPVIVHHQGDP
ncbi:MAG TPA: hypothetical protein VFY45_11310 [Baekduia sp.]|nr:hypothetical protein [Baekduia sp.]